MTTRNKKEMAEPVTGTLAWKVGETPNYKDDPNYGKFLSGHDRSPWELGVWRKIDGDSPIATCANGFHCSPTVTMAASIVSGNAVALVEVRGESHTETKKSAHREMRVLAWWPWGRYESSGEWELHIPVKNVMYDPIPEITAERGVIDDAFTAAVSALMETRDNVVGPANQLLADVTRSAHEDHAAALAKRDQEYNAAYDAGYKAWAELQNKLDAAHSAATDAANKALSAITEPAEKMCDAMTAPARDAFYAARDALRAERQTKVDALEAKRADISAPVRDTYTAALAAALGKPQGIADGFTPPAPALTTE